jgi:hypothetical protein
MKAPPESVTTHPFRQHFIRREFTALDGILQKCAGKYCVGDQLSVADCFLVPQVRNAFGAQIDIEHEFPSIFRVWSNCLLVPAVSQLLEECGGIVQPFTSTPVLVQATPLAGMVVGEARIAELEAMVREMDGKVERIEANTAGLLAVLSAQGETAAVGARNTMAPTAQLSGAVYPPLPSPSSSPSPPPSPSAVTATTDDALVDESLELPPGLDKSITLKRVRANGITMRIAECGSRNARHCLLLLHGWPESWYVI